MSQIPHSALPARYTERELPPYRHLPGATPHPERDPEGHMYGQVVAPLAPVDPDGWHENEVYLWGVDLFNYGYWWEAHTAWERLWEASKGEPTVTAFLQGLIQLAAALLKQRLGEDFGVLKLIGRASTNLREVADRVGGDRFMGVDVEELVENARSYFSGSERHPPWIELGSPR